MEINIDPEFRNLIHPLQKHEYLQLEENICADGCMNPIVLWKGFIIDGHNRYEICTRHNIPFQTISIDFSCRDEAITWICKNQLGRRNISEETRRYLIGRQYESEKKVIRINNPLGSNQYKKIEQTTSPNVVYKVSPTRHTTAQRIADENHITHATVQKYASFSSAIDEIAKKEPALAAKILSGKYKISHENIIELSHLPVAELKKINSRVERNASPYMQYSKTRSIISGNDNSTKQKLASTPTIKDMPAFDPDATVTELSLTIPMWISSIKRMETSTDFKIISPTAKETLEKTLLDLQEALTNALTLLTEDRNG